MQIGQVPIQFVPDEPLNDMRALTAPVDEMQILAPSLPAPVPVETLSEEELAAGGHLQAGTMHFTNGIDWTRWLVIGGLIFAVWYFSNPRR